MTEAITERVTKKRILADTRVVIEPTWTPRFRSQEERREWLQNWAQELMEFFRDHRHQDVNSVCAEPELQDTCSGCGDVWETWYCDDTETVLCASCGLEVES